MANAAFSFMKLVVADLAAAERFYGDVFGLEVSHRHSSGEHQFAQDESILHAPQGKSTVSLILCQYTREPIPPAGSAWTGFIVDDIEATAAAIERGGGSIPVPIHSPDTHPVKALIARDPDGHMIEVIEMTAPQA